VTVGFDRPALLAAGALVLPALALVSRRLFREFFVLEIPLGPPGGIPFQGPVNLELVLKLLRLLEAAGAAALLLAAAGPHFTYTETVWLGRGADVLFVIDTSPSMAALDMDGRSRFDAARELVREFAAKRPQDALGLAAVGEDAALLVPLTTDRDAFLSRLDGLVLGELGDGTALGMGLAVAALHIGRSTAPRRAVVLITDGENNAGSIHPETAAALLGETAATLWVIGVGSGGEVPIDYTDPVTHVRRRGVFDSRYDSASLETLALKAGGVWLAAPTAEAFAAAFERLDAGDPAPSRSTTRRRTEPFHEALLKAALALICLPRVVRRWVLGGLL